MLIGVVMCAYVNEPEVKVCKRTPAVKLPARGLNFAPLIAYPDGRVGSKKTVGKGKKKRMKATSTENYTEGRQKEGEIRDGKKDRKMGKRKELQVEK